MEKEYEGWYSYTLDFISWDCPKCGTHIEKSGKELYGTTCPECGFEREDENNISDTYDESETYYYENEKEE